MVTGELFDRLVNKHELPPQLAIEIAAGARERATLDLVEQAGLSTDPARFVQQLHLNGRLTPSVIMRALCLGHMTLRRACAGRAGRRAARQGVADDPRRRRAGPQDGVRARGPALGMFTAFRLAIDIYHKTEMDGGPDDKDRFRQRMVERVLTQFQAIPRADLEYLLDKLDALDGARERGACRPSGLAVISH